MKVACIRTSEWKLRSRKASENLIVDLPIHFCRSPFHSQISFKRMWPCQGGSGVKKVSGLTIKPNKVTDKENTRLNRKNPYLQVGLKDSVTAITFVALGTSLPDLFASKQAAQSEKTADNSIGNVTGSNSVNVFLGLGLPWTIAAIYWTVKVSSFHVPFQYQARFVLL